MHSVFKLFLSGVVALSPTIYACAGGLVGIWRTDPVQGNPTGHTNRVDWYTTIEFSKGGLFTAVTVMKGSNGQEVALPWKLSGTFKVTDSTHLKLNISKNLAGGTNGPPQTLWYSLSGDRLQLPPLLPIANAETNTYHRLTK